MESRPAHFFSLTILAYSFAAARVEKEIPVSHPAPLSDAFLTRSVYNAF